jgi:hypothetical protein
LNFPVITTVNIDTIQFYNSAFTTLSISIRYTTLFQKQPQSTGIQYYKEISCVLKLYSQSQSICKDIAGKQDSYTSNGPSTTDKDDEFLLIDKVIYCTFSKELSTKEATSTVYIAQKINKLSSADPESSSILVQSSLPGFPIAVKVYLLIFLTLDQAAAK